MRIRGPLHVTVMRAEGPLSRVTVMNGNRIGRDVHVPFGGVRDEIDEAVRYLDALERRQLPGVG